MPKYSVRVTRDLDDEEVDLEIDASTWEDAKAKAIAEVEADPDRYFGSVAPPTYYVRGLDDDEEANIIEDV